MLFSCSVHVLPFCPLSFLSDGQPDFRVLISSRMCDTSLSICPLKGILSVPERCVFSVLLLTSEAFWKPCTSVISGIYLNHLGLDRCDFYSTDIMQYFITGNCLQAVQERDCLMTLDLSCILLYGSQATSLTFPALCGWI